jgi:3-oxoacyl-[acyl-carrier protein] reductase
MSRSSAGGVRNSSISSAFVFTPRAVSTTSRDLAAQVGPFGIRANCIAPETILTERNKERIPEEQQRALIDLHPISRLGTPEDVAQAALFLASDQSEWISGIVVDVAGGVAGYSFS